jgi:hypothetical protein
MEQQMADGREQQIPGILVTRVFIEYLIEPVGWQAAFQ